MALDITWDDLGLEDGPGHHVWGVIMDTGTPEGWHCLVVFAGGTTSLYTSSAFGIIGAGTHERVEYASDLLLAAAEEHVAAFTPSEDTAIPPTGRVAIRVLTHEGRRVVVAAEHELGSGRHPASPVYQAAHQVITQMRQVAF